MQSQAVAELAEKKLRAPCRKVLESLQVHWTGLTLFADDSRIPMDNNASERKYAVRRWEEKTTTAQTPSGVAACRQ